MLIKHDTLTIHWNIFTSIRRSYGNWMYNHSWIGLKSTRPCLSIGRNIQQPKKNQGLHDNLTTRLWRYTTKSISEMDEKILPRRKYMAIRRSTYMVWIAVQRAVLHRGWWSVRRSGDTCSSLYKIISKEKNPNILLTLLLEFQRCTNLSATYKKRKKYND